MSARHPWIALTLATALVGGCQTVVVPQPELEPRTALEACNLATNPDKDSAHWQKSVEMIVPGGEILVLTSGLAIATCQVGRNPDGTWGAVSVGVGRLDPAETGALTHDTGMTGPPADPVLVAVGRAPAGSARVSATAADGDDVFVVLGSGFYVVRVDGSGPLTEVVAWDDAGVELGRLFDPMGLQPPLSSRGTPASS